MRFSRDDKRMWNEAIHLVRAYEGEQYVRDAFASDDLAASLRDDMTGVLVPDGVERDALGFDATTINRLLAHGYLERLDPQAQLVKPTSKAYEAEFTDANLPLIREIFAALGEPIYETFAHLRDSGYPDPHVLELEGALHPLVQEGWLQPEAWGHVVTVKGRSALERTLIMHEGI